MSLVSCQFPVECLQKTLCQPQSYHGTCKGHLTPPGAGLTSAGLRSLLQACVSGTSCVRTCFTTSSSNSYSQFSSSQQGPLYLIKCQRQGCMGNRLGCFSPKGISMKFQDPVIENQMGLNLQCGARVLLNLLLKLNDNCPVLYLEKSALAFRKMLPTRCY